MDDNDIVYKDLGDAFEEIEVSDATMGGLGSSWYKHYLFNIDLTKLCKKLLERSKMALYLTFKNKCTTSLCFNKIGFPNIRSRDINKRPKI